MTLTVTSLASGSSGNAILVRYQARALLVDCGLSQRALERALAHAGLAPADVQAVVRLATLYNVVLATNTAAADFIVSSPLFAQAYEPADGAPD